MTTPDLSQLTDEQRAELEQRIVFEQAFAQPISLPIRWSFSQVEIDDDRGRGLGVLVQIQRPTDAARYVFERDSGLAFASQMRKALHGGQPKLGSRHRLG